MARTVRDARIESRNARLKLLPKSEPYWRAIGPGTHLGYYRSVKQSAGSWIARFRAIGQRSGGYRKCRLGTADDVRDPDGGEILSFAEAQEKARQWFVEAEQEAIGPSKRRSARYTVADACTDYLDWYKKNRKAFDDAARIVQRSIVPALGHYQLTALKSETIRSWHEAIADRRRGTRSGQSSDAVDGQDANARRARRATANRHLTVLKAALNKAFQDGLTASDSAWRSVKAFRNVDSARLRYLNEEECRRLLNACHADFRLLVHGALVSGCRYSELTRLTASDFLPDSGSLLIQEAKAGKSRHVPLDDHGLTFFSNVTAGRPSNRRIFLTADGKAWGKSYQARPLAAACEAARIDPPITFHGLRHTWASQRVMKGAPLIVVAQVLGHADTRMVEKHYGHLAPSYVRDVVRATALDLGEFNDGVVRSIQTST